jgi:hypothetical protein
MKTTLPEPLSLLWELRPVSSARSGFETLADGRRKFWLDEFLKGINPKMLVWWFSHPTSKRSTYGGCRTDQSVPGRSSRICEFIDRNPRYNADLAAIIEKLNEDVFINNVTRRLPSACAYGARLPPDRRRNTPRPNDSRRLRERRGRSLRADCVENCVAAIRVCSKLSIKSIASRIPARYFSCLQ